MCFLFVAFHFVAAAKTLFRLIVAFTQSSVLLYLLKAKGLIYQNLVLIRKFFGNSSQQSLELGVVPCDYFLPYCVYPIARIVVFE